LAVKFFVTSGNLTGVNYVSYWQTADSPYPIRSALKLQGNM
jgi:hypothetical protein